MNILARTLTGTTDGGESPREVQNRALARRAAAEGFVLLKNQDGILPLDTASPLAIYGYGASRTIKGGTGSGDVNERRSVSIAQGLAEAGYPIVNQAQIDRCDREYAARRLAWRDEIMAKAGDGQGMKFFEAYCETVFIPPVGEAPEGDMRGVTGVYVLSRTAGEGRDRRAAAGDYFLSPQERALLDQVCAAHERVVLIINSGAVLDLSFLDELPVIRAVLLMGQAGMEGGRALADVLSGRACPCGKLTDSWAYAYGDYPSAADFTSGNAKEKHYTEGIYVGYRYFDSFGVPVRYGFGYGLSYTRFTLAFLDAAVEEQRVSVQVRVRNAGGCAGREVAQVYVSCPQGGQPKEFRRLAAFGKTQLLAPGQEQVLTLSFPLYQLASFREDSGAWVLEAGGYVLWLGSSLEGSEACAVLELDGPAVLDTVRHICPLREPLEELTPDSAALTARLGDLSALPRLSLQAGQVQPLQPRPIRRSSRAKALAASLREEQLVQLMTGDPSRSQNGSGEVDGLYVPGSAAETSGCAQEQGLVSIVLADGPAGLRLNKFYDVDGDGRIIRRSFAQSLEGGLFVSIPEGEGTRYYQYCTAFPVGVLLAQSWDTALLWEVGRAVAGEMREFGVTLWLAPGMNIHRDPLCGRNFEYYSEDPLVSGVLASAITRGVQSVPGCGTTIKHFACNSSEDDRYDANSVLSERALREIYLKGFEIAVRDSQPMSIMTSYNLVNGEHTANSRGLCTVAAREEWGFAGAIMTDWLTTVQSPRRCTASGCVAAGNDLVMPGVPADQEDIRRALASGELSREALMQAAENIVELCLCSARYEGVEPYGARFDGLGGYLRCE